ncbi:hypothetical protein LCGC14_2861330, partial [marine sediment metagenome]
DGFNMAITADADTNGGENTTPYNHTCTGANLLLVVLVALRDGVDAVDGITYNSVALTQGHTRVGNGMQFDVWYLINPATGSNVIAVDTTSIGNDYHTHAASFAGVLQASPADDTGDGSADGANPAFDLIPSTDGQLLIGGHANEDGGAGTTGTGETTLSNNDDGVWSNGFSYAIQTSKATQSMNWTWASDTWAGAGLTFKEVVAAPSGIASMRQLIGHGQGTR